MHAVHADAYGKMFAGMFDDVCGDKDVFHQIMVSAGVNADVPPEASS